MSATRNVILVTGATGHVGRQVVSQLLDAGATVRALTRNPSSANLPDKVEVVRGDLADPETLESSLDGVAATFLVWPLGTAEAAPPVLAALKRHTRRIIYLSSMSVRDDVEQQSDKISAFHAEIERLIKQSELEWTFLRASGFAANTLGWAAQIRASGVVRWPFGAMARSLIHERDIAAVAMRALTESGHVGRQHILTGPQAVSQVEQVHTIGAAIGRPVRWEEISPAAARQDMLASWGDPALVDSVLAAWASMATTPEPVTSTVEQVTGAPARTFRTWATDHANDFR